MQHIYGTKLCFYLSVISECVKKYLEDVPEKSKVTMASIDAFPDEPAYKRCQSSLNSGSKLETLVCVHTNSSTFSGFSFQLRIENNVLSLIFDCKGKISKMGTTTW